MFDDRDGMSVSFVYLGFWKARCLGMRLGVLYMRGWYIHHMFIVYLHSMKWRFG